MSEEASYLDRPIPPGQRDEWAAELAQEVSADTAARKLKFFIFRAGAEWFALDPALFAMTLPDARPRRLPHSRNSIVEGLVNADGRVIACISLERFFGLHPSAQIPGTRRLLVLHWQKWFFAVRAGEVLGVEEMETAEIQPPPATGSETLLRCTQGLAVRAGRAMTCLDPERFAAQLQEAMR